MLENLTSRGWNPWRCWRWLCSDRIVEEATRARTDYCLPYARYIAGWCHGRTNLQRMITGEGVKMTTLLLFSWPLWFVGWLAFHFSIWGETIQTIRSSPDKFFWYLRKNNLVPFFTQFFRCKALKTKTECIFVKNSRVRIQEVLHTKSQRDRIRTLGPKWKMSSRDQWHCHLPTLMWSMLVSNNETP